VLDAFRRNDNAAIEILHLQEIDDMTDDILGEIVDIVASTAAANVLRIHLWQLNRVAKIPAAVGRFTSLQYFHVESMNGIKTLPSGSLTFTSDDLQVIYFGFSSLEVIASGAFQGNFNGTYIPLAYNYLTKFDEAVFKPLLLDSTAEIDIGSNPIDCNCDLAWFIRDSPELVLSKRVSGDCLDKNGTRIDFDQIDPTSLKNC